MTFEPGGDARIPNQIGASGPDRGGRPAPGSPQAFTAAIVQVALVNSVLLTAAIVAVYALELVDPQTGVWLVVGAALVGGVLMAVVVIGHQRRRAQYAQSPQGKTAAGSPNSPTQQQGAPPAHGQHSAPAHTSQSAPPLAAGTPSFQVEDTFTITGRGTVVTGKVTAGEIHAGQQVSIIRENRTLGQHTIAGVEVRRAKTTVAREGEAAGLLLPGIDRSDIHRGDLIVAATSAPGSV